MALRGKESHSRHRNAQAVEGVLIALAKGEETGIDVEGRRRPLHVGEKKKGGFLISVKERGGGVPVIGYEMGESRSLLKVRRERRRGGERQ